MPYTSENEVEFMKGIRMLNLAAPVSTKNTADPLQYPKMLTYFLFPSAVIGIDYTVSEKSIGIVIGKPVHSICSIFYNKRSNNIEFASIEGIFSSRDDLLNNAKPSLFVYQFGIIVLGLISGFCILKVVDKLTRKRNPRNNYPQIEG